MSGIIVVFWFAGGGVALRYFVSMLYPVSHLEYMLMRISKILFMGVMSTMYVLWDIIDDTIKRKANASDASAFADICGCFPPQGVILSFIVNIGQYLMDRAYEVWGIIWLLQAIIMFAAGVIIGLVAFKVRTYTQFHPFTDTKRHNFPAISISTSCRCSPHLTRARRTERRVQLISTILCTRRFVGSGLSQHGWMVVISRATEGSRCFTI